MKQGSKGASTDALIATEITADGMVKWTTQSQSLPSQGFQTVITSSNDYFQAVPAGSDSANRVIASRPSEKTQNEENTGKPGVKADQGKLMWNLLPWKACQGLIQVLTFGARKYSPNGWRSVPDAQQRYLAAALRHLHARSVGEKYDAESGLRHIDHVMANVAFLAELED